MTTDQVITIVIAVLGSGALTGVINWFTNRKKNSADTESVSVGTATELVQRQQSIIDRQDMRLKDQDSKITNLSNLVDNLTRQVTNLQIEAMKAKRYKSSLLYLVQEVGKDFPVAVSIAEKIANGELILPPPLGNGT